LTKRKLQRWALPYLAVYIGGNCVFRPHILSRRVFVWLVLLTATPKALLAESPESLYKKGYKAEQKNDYDSAYQAYKLAYNAKLQDPKYMAAFTRMKFYAATEHVHRGEQQRSAGKLQEAIDEFRLALQIDQGNYVAAQDLRATADELQKQTNPQQSANSARGSAGSLDKLAQAAAGPLQLEPISDAPVILRMSATSDVVYRTICKLIGVNVLIDPDYKPQKITVELNEVSYRDALDMVALQSKTAWTPVSKNTIMVYAENSTKRKEREPSVMKTFYLQNASTPAELQEAAGTLKGILDITRIQVSPAQRALIIRGTPDQMILAQKLLNDLDKPRAEVMIDLVVMQVSRSKLNTFGTTVPTSASVTMIPGSSSAGSGGSGGGSGSTFSFNDLAHLNASNFIVSIPGSATFTALMSDSHTRVLQRPEIRALDSEKATLKIGDRVPIATGSFQGGLSNLVNTQFQYLDVGVNVDITPYVHSDHDITLKMTLEVSSVTGFQNIGGISQPTIGQRRIDHEVRLRDGEINLIGGILQDTESTSLAGYPWLTKIPILKYLFGQETKDRREDEIVFAIIPHIVRANEPTDDNLRMVDLGRGNTVTYRSAESRNQKPDGKQAPAQPAAEPKPIVKPSGN
jgi:general secretion pathway protein D